MKAIELKIKYTLLFFLLTSMACTNSADVKSEISKGIALANDHSYSEAYEILNPHLHSKLLNDTAKYHLGMMIMEYTPYVGQD